MTSKSITILVIISILITINCITINCEEISEESKNIEESEEIVEETTIHSEDDDYFKTTTVQPQEDEVKSRGFDNEKSTDEEIQKQIDKVMKKGLDVYQEAEKEIEKELNNSKVYRDEFVVNTTDINEITESSLNNDVDEQSNLTNNIDIATKTETIPLQTTTKAFEDDHIPFSLENKEMETSLPRIPKSDNDSERDHTQTFPSPPQSTRSIVRGWLDDSWIRSPVGILVPLRATALNRALAVWTDLNTNTLNLSRVCFMGYDENGVSWRSKHNIQLSQYGNQEKTVTEALSKLLLKYQVGKLNQSLRNLHGNTLIFEEDCRPGDIESDVAVQLLSNLLNGVTTESRGDSTMRALIGAAKLVPYDSALFILTDERAGDANKLPLALRAVIEKRLKVYTIWTNPNTPLADNDEGLKALENISRHTEGDLLPYPLQVIDVDGTSNLAELEQWAPIDNQARRAKLNHESAVDKFDLLVVRRASQAINLGIPVEHDVNALRILIEGAVEHAVLYPPNEAQQIDLYNTTSVAMFSPFSRTESLSPRDVYLVFPGNYFDLDTLSVLPAQSWLDSQGSYVGMWHLSVRCDTCEYRLSVSARSRIHFEAAADSANSLKFRVKGPVASVRESQLVDEYGTELAKLQFSYQPMAGQGQDTEKDPTVELIADVALPSVKAPKIYARIVGRDVQGDPFVRLTGPLAHPEVRMGRSASIAFPDSTNDLDRAEDLNSRAYNSRQLNDSGVTYGKITQVLNQQGTLLTTIQIGLASKLYGSPGDRLQLNFDVTNYRDQTIRFSFGAVGELRFLTGIRPTGQNIASGQTATVTVDLTIPSSAQSGVRDTITFTAYGIEQVSMSAYVYVSNPGTVIDTWSPEVRHSFQGTCLGKTGDDCAQHTWAVTVIARDALSGLLRLSSTPPGLMYTSDFISGTRQEVTATYRATCCAPRILVSAVDSFGNSNSYVIDISSHLTESAIAAVVLGVFLAIALIILLVLLIYWCVKKRRESRELPNYTTRS